VRFDGNFCSISPIFHSDDDEDTGKEVTFQLDPAQRVVEDGTEISCDCGLFHGVGILESVERTAKHK
jgi:hypothetical protein